MSERCVAVLTSGGDCSGMNAAIRGVVRKALGHGVRVLGIRKGYNGLLGGQWEEMTTRSVSGVLQRGGTFLQSARSAEMYREEGQRRAAAKLQENGIDGLAVIGGEGSLKGALTLQHLGIPVVVVPASIDNDIPCTDMSLGVDTALNNIIHAVDAVKDTASSHDRAFVVETMGRNCGYLAVTAAIACGAEFAVIPEAPFLLDEICARLRERFEEGRSNSIVMVAEGAGQAQEIADRIKHCIGFETRIIVLGHYQRGGSPTVFDRLVGLAGSSLRLTPLAEVVAAGKRPIDPNLLTLAGTLGL